MKKQNQSARERYVSAEKLQQVFAQLGIELCAGRKRIRATQSEKSISKKLPAKVCGFKKNPHLCSDLHLKQATMFANFSRWHFLCPLASYIVPTPVWSVNAPTACFRWRSTGKRNFFCSLPVFINIMFHFN